MELSGTANINSWYEVFKPENEKKKYTYHWTIDLSVWSMIVIVVFMANWTSSLALCFQYYMYVFMSLIEMK